VLREKQVVEYTVWISCVIVTTLSKVGYASVNEHKPPQTSVVTNLFHDSCSLVEAPDYSFTVGLLLISGKGHLQSIGKVWYEKTRRHSLAPLSTCSGISRWDEDSRHECCMVVRTRKDNALRRNADNSM